MVCLEAEMCKMFDEDERRRKSDWALFAIYTGCCCVVLGEVAPTISSHCIFEGVSYTLSCLAQRNYIVDIMSSSGFGSVLALRHQTF